MSLLKHMESWKDIEGYEGLYQISSLGRVKSLNYLNTGNEQCLKLRKTGNGYFHITLCKNGKIKQPLVHRLVAEAFIPNPLNLPCVNHKNENNQVNYAENLEWCSQKYNINYGTRNKKVSKKLSKKVLCIETNTIYFSTKDAQRQTGISNSNIVKCCNGNRKKAGGYSWKYID